MAKYDITTLDSALEFDTTYFGSGSLVRIPNKDMVAILWMRSATVLNVQTFSVNKSSGTITANGSPVDIESGTIGFSSTSLIAIDDSNLIAFWNDQDGDGDCQLLSIDGSGNITTNGSITEFDGADGTFPVAVLMDSTHILNIWKGVSGDGFAQIFTVDTGAGTITAVGTPLEFDTNNYSGGAVCKLNDNKVIVAYNGLDFDGYCRVLSINTSTWAVTSAGSAYEFLDANTVGTISINLLDDTSPMVVSIGFGKNATSKVAIQTFSINTSTWAITPFGSELELTASGAYGYSTSQIVDDTHLVVWYEDSLKFGDSVVLTYNPSDGGLSSTGEVIQFENTSFGSSPRSCEFGNGFFVLAWSGSGSDGYIQSFQVDMGVLTGNFFQFF